MVLTVDDRKVSCISADKEPNLDPGIVFSDDLGDSLAPETKIRRAYNATEHRTEMPKSRI